MKFKPEDRKAQIIAEALRQARARGYQNVRVEHIAASLGITAGLIYHYYKTVPLLKRAIMGAAIAQRLPEIVAQGLVAKDPRAMNADDSLKASARATV
jgi:AcrR family transcriptional regulator